MQRGEIYLAELHSNGIGSEQKMCRPVIIVQNNMGNKYSPTVTVLPLTSQKKKALPTHVALNNTKCLLYPSVALAEQITTISKERFITYIGMTHHLDMSKIENAIKIQNGLTG